MSNVACIRVSDDGVAELVSRSVCMTSTNVFCLKRLKLLECTKFVSHDESEHDGEDKWAVEGIRACCWIAQAMSCSAK